MFFIWGEAVDSYEDTRDKLKTFFSPGTYVNKGKSSTELNPKQYWDDLLSLCNVYPDEKSLYVEYRHIEFFNRELADRLIANPEEWFEAATEAISEMAFPTKDLPDIQVRVVGLPQDMEVSISKLRGIHLNRFLSIRCVISKASEVRPGYAVAGFQCMRCGHTTRVTQLKYTEMRQEPFAGCENETCGKKGPYKLDDENSITFDHQYLKVQEPLENLRGRQPEFLYVSCADDIAGTVKPGDKVIITGILKGKPKTVKEGVTKYLDFIFVANSIEKSDTDYENLEITPDEEEQFKQWASEGVLKAKILRSIAPSIFGLEDVKLGLALQMVGGVPVEFEDGTRKRGDIHIMLVGDPGVAKSQLLEFVAKFSPRAVSFSGKSTSEAGLTGGAVKDELDGKWWIQPGALTLADGGICCADELDKMKTGQLGSIHEALEQQMVHINKVVKADLWTRTAFLGAANPKYGRYDKYTPIAEQITHGDAFISRMDLLFVLLDTPNEATDRMLAKHILGTLRGKKDTSEPGMDLELFRKCIAYIKTHVFPVLNDESEEMIINFFVGTRTAANGRTDTVPITARTLEAAFRLATAHARIRLSNTITEEDAEAAVNLLYSNLRSVGIDPETGELDANVLACGTSMSQSRKLRKLCTIIKSLSERDMAKNKSAKKEDVIEKCISEGIKEPDKLIQKLKQQGDIMCPEEGYYKLV